MMQSPTVQEVFSDVTTLLGGNGDIFEARCGGLLQFVGTFPSNTLEISFDMGASWLPINNGSLYPVSLGQKYRLRETISSAGTLTVIAWPVDPANPASVTAAVVAASSLPPAVADETVFFVSNNGSSSANAAQNVDIAAPGANRQLLIESVHVTFEGNTIQADTEVQLLDGVGGTVMWNDVLGVGEAQGTTHQTPPGFAIPMTENTLARLSVEAGGASVITHATISGRTITV